MNSILERGLKKVQRESRSFPEKFRKITFPLWFIHPIVVNVFSTPNHAAVKRKSEFSFFQN